MADNHQYSEAEQAELRKKCENRLDALKSLRRDYEPEWYDIARFAQPSRSRFLVGGNNSGTNGKSKENRAKRRHWNSNLLDPKGIESFRTLTNGMTSGLTSSSRPWFTLKVREEMMDDPEVRDWLSETEKRMYGFLAGTNFYGAAKAGYAELGLFGTEACVMLAHPKAGAVCHSMTAGEYWIACGDQMSPDVLYRHIPMTVREAVQTFGEKVSERIKKLYDTSQYSEIVDIYQAIEPDSDYNPKKFGDKPWRSVYWDSQDNKNTIISCNGFEEQPFWAPRWDLASGETYGSSPGMDALPALRELQMQAKRRNETVDQVVKPEKVAPPGIRLTGQAGRIVTGSGFTRDNFIIPYETPYQHVAVIREEMNKNYEQIDALSYANLFNAITNMQGIQPRTVEEIATRNEEKLTQLGPVIERVSTEKLEVVIDRTFGIMLRQGRLPDVPEILSEAKLEVEFVSILTQMQRMVGIGQIERTTSFIGNLAGVKPEALDKLDVDELIDEYADRAGAPPKIIRGAKEVNKDREERASQQQQMMQQAQMTEAAPAVKQGAEAARLLSEADSSGVSVLDRLQQGV